ncbi:hypothetical protein [Kutzneria albida]|uniref:Uncharacterized protein n=1 Tax=Kutzneria albida DSM 43870 TaxID=1449976 RepID=W5WBP9_9PSEU|nr:hypothetical protein [Kutzneria albida]AHH98307.1 hypothetical protein KALB_4945 [Kutzneria albida DSM 43870]
MPIRTTRGAVLPISITPADVIASCDTCQVRVREGDWYCQHLAARYGHQVALLTDKE